MSARADAPALLTVGHGTLDGAALGALLVEAGVRRLVDVRRFPGSRNNPAAKRPALEEMCAAQDIGYSWDERLGGRRRLATHEVSPDTWWRVEQFRAYAGWTRTPDFRDGLADLLEHVTARRTAVLCSESVWWRCHRRLIADVVVAEHDTPVLHLMHDGRQTPHRLSDGARVGGDGRLVWDREPAGRSVPGSQPLLESSPAPALAPSPSSRRSSSST